MYFSKTPQLIKLLFPDILWNKNREEKYLYLSFDDGPTTELTEWILDQLKTYNAKASFFCIGKNSDNHPLLIEKIIKEGHTIGNHSQNHLSGWGTSKSKYLNDIEKASTHISSNLFRPPFGKLLWSQYQNLKKKYKIVMWDVMSGDFDINISSEQCLDNVIKHAKNGSIVVFHDNLISKKHLQYTLPRILLHFSMKGYIFCKID